METAFVEEVAASLVREFLSKKGLSKTSSTMDQEFPRTALSINNRNELRKILHLQPFYKLNKTKENPLKTILEIMTSCFLEQTINFQSPPVPQNKHSQLRASETPVPKSSFSDEDTGVPEAPETNQTERCSYGIGEEINSLTFLSRRHRVENKKGKIWQASESSLVEGEKKLQNSTEEHRTPELSSETRTAMREKVRTKPGLIIRGMMAGPTASFQEDSVKRRHLKRPSGISNSTQLREEDRTKSSFGVPSNDFQETKGTSRQSANLLSLQFGSSLDIGKEHSSKMLFGPHANTADEKAKNSTKVKNDPVARWVSDRPQTEARKSASSYDTEGNEKSSWLNGFPRPSGDGREKPARPPRKSETRFSDCRKTPTSISSPSSLSNDALELVDVEDEVCAVEACRVPDPLVLFVLQVKSKPIDFCLARDLKILLFGSSLSCFSEEWKIQSFVFSDIPELKYGIVQKKGGPCGVLAAVQACVLRHLIFGDSSQNNGDPWILQPSEAHRTKCLALALTDILWRAGGSEKATVALCSGTQQFTPAGKYKADGILETMMLHEITNYEDLLKFLQKNIYEFEAGPHGCILLTLSAILSRSINQVRGDFDVVTNRLIGAHGYCTQELVNLLLTGKAVSNVFNDVIELDSGNGNTTVLKGVSGRSEVGLLSLFEHYDVCQVGCYLKTPKFPIWLVCSESHFTVLFSTRKDLLGDWKTERRFDLHYYDGLANQQEEMRLTIDTSQPYFEDRADDLIPPLEHCIRTKWKGAVVNWNGTEPIL
ncbi:probable ubiquitin carboxyl-terminal hydrolase MINDY-4 [Eublepharis macularius]|uniref:Ubiquitin carboxyl-terminal hydrolase MINDY n=1 Tax=Eublepharis macularius TaxID=481883 RepID=A0AA97LAV6_EUBMA|nr:probable ubiquitin carboxyl-terminal hydrolase MINDY-4 [Eublepharis macularius]